MSVVGLKVTPEVQTEVNEMESLPQSDQPCREAAAGSSGRAHGRHGKCQVHVIQ